VLVEVLPSEEFDDEHLPRAINLPLTDRRPELAETLLGTDRRRPIVVYCQSGD